MKCIIMLGTEANWATIQISPDRKWIALGPDDWIYVLDENDHLVDPSGKPHPFTPGVVPNCVVLVCEERTF